MRRHQRILSPSFAKGLVVVLFALCVAAWYLVAEKNPAHASVGDTVPQSVQKGVNFLTPDVVNWTKQNSCIACHRQGASLYGLANAKSRGYEVDTSKDAGIGFIAQKVNDEQQPDGRWTHFGSYNYAKTSYAFFGMAGYDKFVGTEYSRNLVSAANWAVNNQIVSGPYGYWIEDHGSFPTTYGNAPVTARMMVGIAQARQRVDSATASLYQQRLDLAAAWLRANRDSVYGNGELAYTFQVAYALIGLKASGAANDDPDVLLFRDRLLAATSQPTGRGWGYTAGHGADEFNTGIALYALGRVGIKPRTNQTVRDAINWLRDQQVDVAGTNNGYWRSNNFSSLDIPTTFAILGLSDYGDLGVDLSLDGADHHVIRSNFAQPQTVTYALTLTNDGAFDVTDTYSLHVEGGLPGWTASVEPTFVTLPSGQSSPVLLTVTAPANLPEALPVEMTVVATSDTDSKISANVKVTTYTDPPPPTSGDPTQIVFVEGANAVVNSRRSVQTLAAQVKDVATNAVVHGPRRGVTTFYVAGIAVGTDVDADGDGIFRLDWTPGEAWAATGPQDLRAVYSGIDLPDPQADLLPSFAASTIDLDLTNRQPTLQAGGPYSVPEGGRIVLTAAGSNLGGGSASYSWDLDGDGTFETPGQSVSFSAAGLNGPGSYPVRAQVVTTAGRQATAQTVVNVQNVPPVLIPPVLQTATEGSPASFDLGWLSDPGPDSPWTVNIDWGDGSPASSFKPTSAGPLGKQPHVYADSGLYTVTLNAADKDGATDTKSFRVKVFNVPPAVTAPPDQPAEAGVARSFDLGAFTDPGPDSTWIADVDWGDASTHTTFNLSAPGALAAQAHTYAANGNYTVTVRVTDKDGGVGSATFKVAADHIAVVRHALKLTSGRVEGTIRQLLGENGTLGGNALITSDLKVPGVPSVRIDGSPAFGGTIEGAGSTEPSNYQLTVNGNATLGGHLVTRTDPIDLPPLAAPSAPTGTRDVILKQAGQVFGDPATLRNLTLTGNAGQVAVPPGTYGKLSADSHTTLLLGRANSAQPAVYNLQDLRLNGGSALRLAGPVTINVANKVILDGSAVMGTESAPRWLKLNVAGDGRGLDDKVSVRGGSALYALVRTPLGRIAVGGNNSLLRGAVACDYLDVSGSSSLHLLSAVDAAQTNNKPPSVNAGPDQTIALPSSEVTLNGAVTDDGLPADGVLIVSWSEVSGPGPVIFSRADAASTRATFTEAGTYVLRLTASDSLLAGSDDISINVGLDDQAPVVNAGLDEEVFLPASSTTLSGVVLDDGLPANGTLSTTWNKVSGPGTVTFSRPHELVTDAAFSTTGTYVLRLTASDGQLTGSSEVIVKVSAINQAPVVDAGPDQTISLPAQANLHGAVADDGLPSGSTLGVAWTKISGPGTVTFDNAGDAATTASFSEPGSYLLELSASDSQFTTTSDVLITVKPPNQPPTVSAGATQTITLPDRASLSGMVSDDGQPAGGALTISWAKVSGPGEVTFSNSIAAVTTAAFDQPGTYVLRLTASDSLLASSADVTIVVNPAAPTNQAPTVNAGPDQTITLPAQAGLNGTVSDDGLPANSTVSTVWSKVSGPGTVTFSNPALTATSAAFSTAGTYVLRLTATDSQLTAADDLVVTVQEAPPVNKPPAVNAGPAQTVTLPHTASLVGAVSDDGLPAGGSLTVQWTKVSGPGTVAFSAPDRVTTAATFSDPGAYVLRLTASDSELTASGEVNITVNGPNQPPTVNAGPDLTATASSPVSLHGEVSDDGLPAGGTLSVSWSTVSGPGNVSFINPQSAVTNATFGEAGTYVLRLTASDSELSASDDAVVTVNPAVPPPTVEISAPADGAIITAPSDIMGTVSGGAWKLEYSLTEEEGAPDQTWTTIAAGSTPVAGGPLGSLDPTLLLNGIYTLRLSAVDASGQSAAASVNVVVSRSMKVGNFTISFKDLSVPLTGLPINLIRGYDSRDKRVGDFGVGWSLGLDSVRLQKSMPIGKGWYETVSGGVFPAYCLQATRAHTITVTFPGGKVYQFEAAPSPRCQPLANLETTSITYTPAPGTHASLTPLNGGDIFVAGSAPGPVDFVDLDSPGGYYHDPTQFRLTVEDGTAYVIDQRGGVRSVTDTNGNTLSVGPDGITHSDGTGVAFTRDAAGRISQITDPDGHTRAYHYDADGNLDSYTDAAGNVTSYTYTGEHFLQGIRVTSSDGQHTFSLFDNTYENSRLVGQTDGSGNEITYNHDLANRRETVTDRLGNQTVYEYDDAGDVVYEKDAEGAETRRTFDERGNMLTATTAEGTTANVYDDEDNLTQTTDPYGNVRKYAYNALRKVTSATDAKGNVTTSVYDDATGNLLSKTDAEGNQTQYTYSARGGRLVAVKRTDAGDPDHPRQTSYTYFPNGYLQTETDPLGHVESYTYDANGNLLGETVTRTTAAGTQESLTTSYAYDGLNQLVKTTYPDGSFTTASYNELGLRTASTDQLGRVTSYEYDEQGQLVRTVYPDGLTEESKYDAGGRCVRSIDRASRATSYGFDKTGRPTETLFPDGGRTTTSYDALGRVLEIAHWLDATHKSATTYRYDAEGHNRVVYITDALGHVTKQTFDETGRLWKVTDANNHIITYDYDKDGRRTRVTYQDGTYETTVYDGFGEVVAMADQAGKTTRFSYDSAGRLVRVADTLNRETAYAYDELGRETAQTDANNHTTTFEYDKLGNRTKRTLPEGMSELFTYDGAGSILSRTDFNGKTTTYAYDELGRLKSKTPDTSFGQQGVSYTYTPTGRRATMTDATGTTTYAYDARDRLTSKATPEGTLTYTYDKAGNLLSARSANPQGLDVAYGYDLANRLTTVTDNALVSASLGTTAYAYDNVGNAVSCQYGNGVQSVYTYNALNRLTGVTASAGGNTIASYTYTLGSAGNRLSVSEQSGRAVLYGYDDLYRLINEAVSGDPNASGDGAVHYGYDNVGNRLTRTSTLPSTGPTSSTFDKNDRLAGEGYDSNGNTKSLGGTTYTYDFQDRLTDVNGGAATYAYDGDGNRVAETVAGVKTKYLVDTNNPTGYPQVVEELTSGAVTRVYTYGRGLISQRQLVGEQWQTSFYGTDGHGSARYLTDAAGTVTDRYDYDAFGNLTAWAGGTPNERLYASEQYDPQLGLYYLRARYFNPQTGRFVTADPYLGEQTRPVTLHRYLYAGADPVNHVDPTGKLLEEEEEATAIETTLQAEMQAGEAQLAGSAVELAEDTGANVVELEVEPAEELLEAESVGADVAGEAEAEAEAEVVEEAATKTNWGQPSSRVLRANMKKAGAQEPGYRNAAHHIVAGRAKAAEPARARLTELGVSSNDADNGVFLRTGAQGSGALHTRLHTNVYYQAVNKVILAATTTAEAREALKLIGAGLSAGTFPW